MSDTSRLLRCCIEIHRALADCMMQSEPQIPDLEDARVEAERLARATGYSLPPLSIEQISHWPDIARAYRLNQPNKLNDAYVLTVRAWKDGNIKITGFWRDDQGKADLKKLEQWLQIWRQAITQ